MAGSVDGGANSAYANTAGSCTPIKCVGALVGDQAAGTKWTPATANAKRVSRFSSTTPVSARQLRAYVDGKGGAAGSQSLRGVLYADNAGSPSRRLAKYC